MTDNYRTYWVIKSRDNKLTMQFCKFSETNVEMQVACEDPIQFNSKRDCVLFLLSLGVFVDDYNFVEEKGNVKSTVACYKPWNT